MSMRGSPINWWKDKRQSSHSGIPHANRPQTAFPWSEDRDISKIVEEAVLAAFESTAFKVAVASQVDPAFSRHQDKLNQIKTTNLNLESTLQAHVEDLPGVLKGLEDQLTGLVIPDYRHDLEALAVGQERLEGRLNGIHVPDHTDELNEIVSGQTRFLKTFENRLSALESRIEDLDRKTGDLEEAVVNADLRSAIRFGEISNELQDRNTTLNNSIWEVQRDLGKKTDALQRRVVGACEDMGKSIRASADTIETMRVKWDEDDVLAAVNKVSSRAEFSEKALRRSITAIQDKVSGLDTSAFPVQIAKLEVIERGISDFKREAEAARNLASVSSKFLSANTTKLDSMASAVGKMHILVESTNEICHEVSESQELNAGSIKEDVEAVRMHVRSLDNLAVSHSRKLSDATSILTRTQGAVVAFDAAVIGRLGDLASSTENIEESLRPLSSHSSKFEGLESSFTAFVKDSKPQRAILDDLKTALWEMRSNVDMALSSHTDSLKAIHQTVSNTTSKDGLSSALSKLQSSIEEKISSSHETTSQSTVEAIATHVGSLDGKLQNEFRSLKDDTESRSGKLHSPLSEILVEVRSSKALFETEKSDIRKEFTTTRTAIETCQAELGVDALSIKRLIQDIQEAGRDEEILLQVESWGQNCIAKQAAEVTVVKELLESSRERDEGLQKSVDGLNGKSDEMSTFLRSGELKSSHITSELAALKSLLEDDEKLVSLQTVAKQTSQSLTAIQQEIQHIKDDSTLPQLKDLVQQNASLLATAHQGIKSIKSDLKTSEDNIQTTVLGVQTALAKDIAESKTALTEVVHKDTAESKADFSSRVSTATNVLRAEIKSFDLGITNTAIEALQTELLTSINNSEIRAQDLKDSVEVKIEVLGRSVKDVGDAHSKELQSSTVALAGLKELSISNNESLSLNLKSLQKSVNPIPELVVDISAIAALSKDIDATMKSNNDSLSTMKESLLTTTSEKTSHLTELKNSIEASNASLSAIGESLSISATQTNSHLRDLKKSVEISGEQTSQTIQNTHMLLTDLHTSHFEGIAKTHSSIETVDSALAKATLEIAAVNASLSSLTNTCSNLPIIHSDIKTLDNTLSDISTSVKATDAVILATSAGIAAEILAVKSDIGGVASSLTRVEEQATKSEDARAKVLAAVEGQRGDFEKFHDVLKLAEVANRESFEVTRSDIAGVGKLVEMGNAGLKADVQSVNTGITSLSSTLSEATASNTKAHETSLAAVQAESRDIRDGLVAEAGKRQEIASKELREAMKSVAEQVDISTKSLGEKVDGITVQIGDINTTLAQASFTSSEAHATTLSTLEAESKSTRESLNLNCRESRDAMTSKFDTLQQTLTADAVSKNESLQTEISATNSKIADSTAELVLLGQQIDRKVDYVATQGGAAHEKTIEALKAELNFLNEAVVFENQKTSVAISSDLQTTQKAIISERGRWNDAHSAKSDAIHSGIQNLNDAFVKSAAETITTQSKSLEALKVDVKTLQDILVTETQSSKTALLENLAVIKSSSQSSQEAVTGLSAQTNKMFDEAASETAKMREMLIAAVETQSQVLSDTLTREVKDIKVVVESAKESTVAEVHKTSTGMSEKVAAAGQTVLGQLENAKNHLVDEQRKTGENIVESIERLSKEIDRSMTDSETSHDATLKAIKDQSTTLLDVLTGESISTNANITSAKELLASELQQTRVSQEATLNAVESTLSTKITEANGTTTQELSNAFSKVEKHHEATLKAVKLTSETCVAVVGSAESHLEDVLKELSGTIDAASSKAALNHTSMLEALTSNTSTLTSHISHEISSSTSTLSTSLTTAQSSLNTLQHTTSTLSTDTSAHFNHANSSRKKADKKLEAITETILDAIRQQGKTTSSFVVDAVEKSVLTGLQNSSSLLEGFIERAAEKTTADVLGGVKSESVDGRKVLEGRIEGLVGVVKEEARMTRKSTEKIETNNSNLSTQINKGFSDLSSENKAINTALTTDISTLTSSIKNEALTTSARIETVNSRVLDEVQKTDIAVRSSLTAFSTSLQTTDSKLDNLTPSLKAIDAAVRVNSAAIARVDKAVLESSSQVKSEIHSSIASLASQLEEYLSETSRRVRGIAEFEMPRLEVLLRRQRDATEVIGGRVIGTTKRFEEMVAGVGRDGKNGGMGLGGSELLGMSGRLRGGSNASSTRSKDSGYRLGALESGGRM